MRGQLARCALTAFLFLLVDVCFAQIADRGPTDTTSDLSPARNALTEGMSRLDFKAGHVGYGNPTESASLDLAHQIDEWVRMCKKVGAAGVDHFYPHVPLSDCWKGPSRYDFQPMEAIVQRTLRSAPNARFFLRLRVQVPDWWTELYPSERVLYVNRSKGEEDNITGHWGRRIYPPSLASAVWNRDTEDLLRAAVQYILRRDWGGRVIGCNPALYHGGEWFDEASMYKVMGDYSHLNQAAFRQWLLKKYREDDPRTVPRDAVPTPEERLASDIGHLRDPARRRRVIDYVDYSSNLMADHAVRLCKVIKEASGGRMLAGVYYGYAIELAGTGVHSWLQDSGTLALRRLLRSPHVDYFSSMAEYVHRVPGKFGWGFGPIDAARAHGKFYILEDEVRTWLDKMDPRILYYILPLKTPEEGVHILRRNFAAMATHGSLEQVADLAAHWLDHPSLLQCVGELAELGRRDWDRSPAAQVALFVDERSCMYQSGESANRLNRPLILDSLVDYFHLGAPIDIFLLSDLTDGLIPLDQYRLYVVLNGFCLAPEQRDYLKRNVQKEGRHVLWYYGPGFLDPQKADREGMRNLTQIRIGYDLAPATLRVKVGPQTFGTSEMVSPIFYAETGDGIEVLGRLQGSEKIGLCRKKMDNWTSIYSAAPCIPADILRGFARDAGVHLYTESDDLVYATRGLVAIHAGVPGEKVIRLPRASEVRDPFDTKDRGSRADTLKVRMNKGETRIWLIRPPD